MTTSHLRLGTADRCSCYERTEAVSSDETELLMRTTRVSECLVSVAIETRCFQQLSFLLLGRPTSAKGKMKEMKQRLGSSKPAVIIRVTTALEVLRYYLDC